MYGRVFCLSPDRFAYTAANVKQNIVVFFEKVSYLCQPPTETITNLNMYQ